MKQFKSYAACLFTLLTVISTAQASIYMVDWSETGSSYGNGSGTLYFDGSSASQDDISGFDYSITGISGIFNGSAISGLLGPFYTITFSSDTTPTLPPSGLDLGFAAGGINYDLYNSNPYGITEIGPGSDSGNDVVNFSNLGVVPEMSFNPFVFVAAAGILCWFRWRAQPARTA